MKPLSKVFTAARAMFYEVKVRFLAEHDLTGFEQEIAHCEADFQLLSNELCHIKAEVYCLQRNSIALEQSISHQEASLVSALQLKQNNLAQAVAKSIATKNCALNEFEKKTATLQQCQQHLQQVLVILSKKIQAYRLELRLVKATSSAHRAACTAIEASEDNPNSAGLSLRLQTIKQKQDILSDQLKATELLDLVLSEHNEFD